MSQEEYQVVAGFVIGVIVLLSAALFIILLITYSNKRKRNFIQEKQLLHQQFTDQLLQSQLEMQEHTFNTISQEIHDNVGQTLSLAVVQLNFLDQGGALQHDTIKQLKQTVTQAMSDLRDISKSLNSDRVRMLSISEMTAQELKRIERLGTMKTTCTIEGTEKTIAEDKKLILFRIIQESLQNILKHSNAEKIDLLFRFNKEALGIEVADDGIGFDPALLSRKDGLGLRNIVTRASLVGGVATIMSSVGNGTKVGISVPYV